MVGNYKRYFFQIEDFIKFFGYQQPPVKGLCIWGDWSSWQALSILCACSNVFPSPSPDSISDDYKAINAGTIT